MPHRSDPATVSPRELEAFAIALDTARRGPTHGPNPRVGCVLLADDGALLATGFHRGAGTPHAEVDALTTARAAGHDPRGATAVVTLEPCNHTGRTGPCSHALVEAGVRRVVFAVADPNPRAAGGASVLRGAGIDVVGPTVGPTEGAAPEPDAADAGLAWRSVQADARELVRAWLAAVGRGRPFVTLKTATTLDGRIAAADGSSRWITSSESRAHAHARRAEVDAIVIGTGTALTDDPSLTARVRDDVGPAFDPTGSPSTHLAEYQPLRVVVGHRELPVDAALRGPGGELVHLETHDPSEVLAALHAREVRHVLVEGGPTLAAAFLRAGLVDELHAYIAPVLLGGGRSAVGDLGVTSIDGALRWETREVHRLGPDVLVVATPARSAPGPAASAHATDEHTASVHAASAHAASEHAADEHAASAHAESDPVTTDPAAPKES